MITRYSIFLVFLWNWVFSFTITFHDDLIPITSFDGSIEQPFLGGFNQPKIQWIDWDEDGLIDLFLLDASGYLRYLNNEGTLSVPRFNLNTISFQNIYCGGWFYFGDFDSDGRLDLMTQNSDNLNHVTYYRNIGGDLVLVGVLPTMDGDFVANSPGMNPTFADIDNDGDLDFFTCNANIGTVYFYQNIGFQDGTPEFQLVTTFWQDIQIINSNCNVETESSNRHGLTAITFFDLEGDGDLDLSWGDFYQPSLYIILNSGTPEVPVMTLLHDEYPLDNPIFSSGRNMPTFADLNGNGVKDLFVTVLSGVCGPNALLDNFYHFKNIGGNSDPIFKEETKNYFSTIDYYSYSSPELVDIDGDDDLDLFIGNHADWSEVPVTGKLYFFRNMGTSFDPDYIQEEISILGENMGTRIKPELGDLDGDGDLDLLVGEFNGVIKYYENIGSNKNLTFSFVENIGNIDLSGDSAPTLGDLDNDGDLDLLIGQSNGSLIYYRNIGNSLDYNFQESTFADISVNNYSAPELVDWDNDGDLDLILGSENEGLIFYWNDSETLFNFQLSSNLIINELGINSNLAVGKLYNMDKIDIIVGNSGGGLYHLQTEMCVAPGDLNGDNSLNILDVLSLVVCILSGNCNESENNCAVDLNNDNTNNVLDVIALANCILSESCGI